MTSSAVHYAAVPSSTETRGTIPPPSVHGRIDDESCRVFQHAAELAGRKWNAAILLALLRGAERFSDIRTLVDGISDRLLSARLRELELSTLVLRTVVPTTPAQVRYALTPAGDELIRILDPLVGWAWKWEQSGSPGRDHGIAAPRNEGTASTARASDVA